MFQSLDLDTDDVNKLVHENILEPENSNNTLSPPLSNGLKEG